MGIISLIGRLISGLACHLFRGYVEKTYIKPMYVKAHDKCVRSAATQNWIAIDTDLEVFLQISTRLNKKSSKITIKNISGRTFEEVVLSVEVRGYFDEVLDDQNQLARQTVRFKDLDSRSQVEFLNEAFLIDFWPLDNGKIIFSYEGISICLVSVIQEGKLQIIDQKSELLSFHRSKYLHDAIEGNWEKKDGEYYNIAYINEAKRDLKEKIWSKLNPPPTFVIREEHFKVSILLRKYWKLESSLKELYCNFLLQEKLISARFWLLVMLNRDSEDENGRLRFDR